MGQDWRLEVRGVRGSFPRPDAGDPFGGNTSCFFLRCGGTGIVLDAGSGLSALGHDLQNDPNLRRLHILITHFHMDHILGLLSFSPFFDPEREIRIYGPLGVRRTLETLIRPPYWPVTFSDFPATVRFYEVTPGMDYDLGGVRMTALAGLHPDGSLYYRLDGAGKRLVYALDCEPDGRLRTDLGAFAQGCGLLVWDAHFAPGTAKPGWGHSTWEEGLEVARLAGAGRVLMTHFNNNYDGAFLLRQEELARERDASCVFAREGMVIAI